MVTQQQLEEINAEYPNEDAYKIMGGLNLSLPQFLSGNRGVMANQFFEHMIPLINPEINTMPTGFEKVYGKYTDSYKTADADYKVLAVVPKYTITGRFKYVYLLQNILTKVYTIVEMSHYECLSEDQGYLRPYTSGDNYVPGDTIKKGSLLYKSNNHDEYGNYRYGLNLNACFISLAENEEDSIIISDECYERASFYNFKQTPIVLNKNQKLLNLYGDDKFYKCFPDIGEHVKDGILYAKRNVNYDNAAAELTDAALRRIVSSDEVCRGEGYVADIDIFINDVSEFEDSGCNTQLLKYYSASMEYHQKIFNLLDPIVNAKTNNHVQYTHELRVAYDHAVVYLDKNQNRKWINNSNSEFEFAYIVITTYEKKSAFNGFKMTDLFGGKGVVSCIWPKENMPRDEFGNVADIILSPPGVPGRGNPGQLYMCEYNFISGEVCKRIQKLPTLQQKISLLIEFANDVNPEEGKALYAFLSQKTDKEKMYFFEDMYQTGLLAIEKPFGGTISLENLDYLYTKYKVKPGKITMKREFKDPFTGLKIDNIDAPAITGSIGGSSKEFLKPVSDVLDKGATPYDTNKKEKYVFKENGLAPMMTNDGRIEYTTINNERANLVPVKAEINKDGFLVRTYQSEKNVIIGKKYYIILKQNPDDKFSARSLGSTNQVGIPNKPSKQFNMMSPYSKSAIRNGEMESDNLFTRLDPDIVHRYMATHSTNPYMIEMLGKMLLTKDPLQVHDLELDDDEIYDDVPAVMFHSYLYSIGIEIQPIYKNEKL